MRRAASGRRLALRARFCRYGRLAIQRATCLSQAGGCRLIGVENLTVRTTAKTLDSGQRSSWLSHWSFDAILLWCAYRLGHLVLNLVVTGQFAGGQYRWDDAIYRRMIDHSYHPTDSSPWQPTNFFPLLPWTTRAVADVVHSQTVAIFIVTIAAQLGAVLAVFAVAKGILGRSSARWSVALLLLFPSAHFLWMFYVEALFIALSAGALLAAERGHHRLAGVAGVGVAMTRVNGILIVLPLIIAYRSRRRIDAGAMWCVLPICGVALVMIAQHRQAGDALGFIHSSSAWGRHTTWPWQTLIDRVDLAMGLHKLGIGFLIDMAAQIGFLCMAACAFRDRARWPLSIALWLALMASVHLASGLMFSWSRYMLDAWPGFLIMGAWLAKQPKLLKVATVCALVALTINRVSALNAGGFVG